MKIMKIRIVALTRGSWRALRASPFRTPRVSKRTIRLLATAIEKNDGAILGVLTIGILDGVQYLLDGHQRREAFKLSKCSKGFAEVRYVRFESMDEMREFCVEVHAPLVRSAAQAQVNGKARMRS